MLQELYPIALERDIPIDMFWNSSVPEILDLVEASVRKEKDELKDRIRLGFVEADAIASRVGYLFTEKKKRRDKDVIMPWDVYPELFKDEKEKTEQKANDADLVAQKAVMEAYAARWNAYRKAKEDGEQRDIQDGGADKRER